MEKPNVILILTDDQRFDTIAALGNPHIQTPNLDRLIARGTTFTHAHIPGGTSGAVCMPSRAMLHTGRPLFHIDGDGRSIPADHMTLGEHFRSNGYRTFATGKWHNGRDAFARGFTDGADIFFGGMADHWNVPAYDFDPTGKYDAQCPQITTPMTSKVVTYRDCDHILSGTHSSELLTNAACRWLGSHTGDTPFFMYVAYLAPHDPRSMPQRFRDRYRDAEIPLPENFMIQHPFDAGVHQIRDEVLADYPRKPDQVREHTADYYAMITHLDHELGRLLDALDRSGQADRTILVFAGDNGLALGRHGLFGKQNLYDHSVRVPLIFAGPGIPRDARHGGLCYLCDIFPTLCALTGTSLPAKSVEGWSLQPAIADGSATGREELYLAYTDLHRGIRTRTHKLIEYRVGGLHTTQLFDLEHDPGELRNLAADPAHSVLLDTLRTRLAALRDREGDCATPWGATFWGV